MWENKAEIEECEDEWQRLKRREERKGRVNRGYLKEHKRGKAGKGLGRTKTE